jgi:hypothetical protein
MVNIAFVFYLHMNLAHIVAATGNGLNEEFIENYLAVDDLFDCFDGCINRSITCCSSIKFFTCYVQPYVAMGTSVFPATTCRKSSLIRRSCLVTSPTSRAISSSRISFFLSASFRNSS